MSTYRTRMSLFSCLLVFLTVLLVGGTALAATNVVVKPSALNGWLLTAEAPPQLTGSGSFVSGPATPPLGNGSAQFTVDATGSYLLATLAFNNTRLADITRLEYSTYRVAGGPALAPALQFNVDYNLTDANIAWQGRLNFEPYFVGTVNTGAWQTWNALTGPTDGYWWASGAPGNATCPQANPCTLTEVLTAYPNIGIHNTLGALLFKAGSGWAGGFTGNVDGFTIGISNNDTTYDFEPETPCTTTCYVNATTGNDAFGGDTPTSAKKTIQAAVNQVSVGGTVSVAAGVYAESPNINKSLTLVAPAGRDATTIQLQSGPTYLGALTLDAATVTVDGFTILGVDGTPTTLASSNIAVTTNANTVVIQNNRLKVGQIDDDFNTGDDGMGLVTYYSIAQPPAIENLTVTNNEFIPVNSVNGGSRAFYINPGVDHFTFQQNQINGKFTGRSFTQAQNGLVENNTVIGDGSSAGLGAWGYPDPTIWGHTIFRNNNISGVVTAISLLDAEGVTVEKNTLSGNQRGLQLGLSQYVAADIDSTTIHVNRNNLANNSTAGIDNTISGDLVDGQCNWWGDVSGPGSNGPGTGVAVSTDVDFNPWLGSNDLNGPCATPTVQFSAATATVAENGGTVALQVTLSEVAGQIIKVKYDTSNGTATAGSDYTAPSNGTLTFNPGVTSQTINVPISNDSLYEGNETFQVTLNNPVYATLGTLDEVEVTIQEDDAPPVVQFSAANVGVNENAGSALIVVSLNTPSALEVRVNYATADGTALAGSDYTATSGELIIPAGQTVSGFVVPVINDAAVEPNETVNLQLATPTNATLGLAAATLTIIDEDTGPLVNFSSATYSVDEADGTATVTVNLSTAAPNAVTVAYATANGTALAGNDYTATSGTLSFAVGESSKTFTVPITNDEVNEAAETILLNLSAPVGATFGAPVNASLTIVNRYITPTVQFSTSEYFVNENSPGVTITVNLSQAANTTVTVAYATSPLTATAGSDYVTATGVVTLTAGQITTTFPVAITDDNIDENDEAIGLTLTNAANATLGTPVGATLMIIDNEGAPLVEFQSAAVLASEGAGDLTTVTVTLSTVSTQTVTVAYATSNGSAIAGLDYTASNGLLTFDPGQTSRTFRVALLDDTLDETDETVQLRLSGAVNASLGAQRNAVLAIVDNDLPPTVGFSTTTFAVNEGDDPVVVAVLLSTPSGISITVPYTLNTSLLASRGATASPDDTLISGVLFFAPGQTQQTLAFVVADDAIHTGNKFISLTLGTPQNATLGIRPLAVVTVVDDEPEDVLGATVSTIYLPLISKSNQLSDN